jgi:hypothetical protein
MGELRLFLYEIVPCIIVVPGMTVITPEGIVVNWPKLALILAVPAKLPVNVALLLSPAATRSLATTPPVMFSRDHADAAVFAMKLFKESLVIAYTVIEEDDESDCAVTTVPDPSAVVSTCIFLAGRGFTVNVCAFDNPPPLALYTVTGNVPTTNISEAGMVAVNCVELTKVVVLLLPLNRTVDFPFRKLDPLTVIVKVELAMNLEGGLIPRVAGFGVFPMRLFVSAAVHLAKVLIPLVVIVLKTGLTVPPKLVHVAPLSCDL